MGQSYKELVGQFGNQRRENVIFTLDAGESMTCKFGDHTADTDTDTIRHFNIKGTAKKISIIASSVATITHINGIELKSPRTLGTAASNTWREGIEWSSIIVRAEIANTSFEIYAS